MAARWISRGARGRVRVDGGTGDRRDTGGNRFDVLRQLDGDSGSSTDGRRDGGNGSRNGSMRESQGNEMETGDRSEKDTVRDGEEGAVGGTRKRTLDTRSPGTHVDSRTNRIRMDEFDLGEIFEEVSNYWAEGSREMIEKAPEGYRQELKNGMELFLVGMKKVMDGISDKVVMERRKREAGEMNVEDKLDKIEDKIKDIQRKNDNVMTANIQDKVKASVKDMERKLEGSMRTLKLTDIDFGETTQDRTRTVRIVTNRLRNDVHPDDKPHMDRILRRTRIQILGRGTEQRRDRSRTITRSQSSWSARTERTPGIWTVF
jgi:hypothetical protein